MSALDTSLAAPVQALDNDDTGAIVTLTAQGAATVLSSDQLNRASMGIKLVIDVTAVGGTPTLVVTLQGKDTASGKYYTILASATISTVSTTVLTVFPGGPVAANVSANDILPRTFRVQAVVAGTTPSVTATIGASLIG
jgi:hypothetical protein